MPPVPSALRKAESLVAHLGYVKGAKEDTELWLSDREAWEFLDWYQMLVDPSMAAEYAKDVAEARAFRDPWLVLDGFAIAGLPPKRLPAEYH